MKYLSRGLAASAAGLLVSAGLASPVFAAPGDCTVSVGDAQLLEGDAATGAVLTFTITGTTEVADSCDGVTVTYATGDDATAGARTATAGTDYTARTGPATLSADTNTATIEVPIIGDTVKEGDETFAFTLSGGNGKISETNGTAIGTIEEDDTIAAGGAATTDRTSGPVGVRIEVSASGCTEATGDAFLTSQQGESGGLADEDTDNPVTDGKFTAELAVPADADPAATYEVVVACGDELYPTIPFDVTNYTGANGYRMVAADGGIFTFGERTFHGSTGDMTLKKPVVGGATDVSDYDGYWIVAADGGVFTFNAEFHGSLGGQDIPAPAVEIEPTPTGKGYFIVLANGKVYTFGDANFVGDMAGKGLNKPVIGMSVTPSGKGYWLVAEDGGIFNFGDAGFFGSMGDKELNAPVIDLAPAVDNQGYYLLGRDGGVFTFGSADFKGSTGDMTLNAPVIAMLVNPTGSGYWLAATDGGLFTFGAGAEFLGSMGGTKLNSPVLDLIN